MKFYLVDDLSLSAFAGLTYAQMAVGFANGDFAVIPNQNPGWPIFISIFYLLIDSDNFIDYSSIVRPLSIFISTATIFPMYFLSRKFFNEKYSIVAASLFAFEPHINFNAGLGFTEPLYLLVIIVSVYFILNRNYKFAYLSFILVGILWWVRVEGIIMFFVLSIVFFFIHRKSKNRIRNYLICVIIFMIVVSPILIQRHYQYDDPFYFYFNDYLFVEDYESTGLLVNSTAGGYIEEKGVGSFIYKFIVMGFYHIFKTIALLSAPYLFIILPFGAIFSLRVFDQDKDYVKANWIVILASLGLLLIPFAVIPDRRYLFYLYPFLIILSVFTIQRIVEYGLSTFSFGKRKKDIFLIIIICLVIILSGFFMLRFDSEDPIEGHEKMEFVQFLVNKLDGRILYDGSSDHLYFDHEKFGYPEGTLKDYKLIREKYTYEVDLSTPGSKISTFNGKSLNEILYNGKTNDAKYIWIKDKNEPFSFLDDIYLNEEQYPYLNKIFDSNERGFKKYQVKVFEIDYEKFN